MVLYVYNKLLSVPSQPNNVSYTLAATCCSKTLQHIKMVLWLTAITLMSTEI